MYLYIVINILKRSRLIEDFLKEGYKKFTLKNILNLTGGNSMLIQFLRRTSLIQRI